MNIIEYAKQFVGKQETAGPNRGPLVDKWKGEVGAGLQTTPIPWCACFGFAMLLELNKLNKVSLATLLGFTHGTWFPESTQSWLDQAKAAGLITQHPRFGDAFLLLKPDLVKGGFTQTPHHFGFFAGPALPGTGELFDTVEGNTVPGIIGGAVSREGDGVYARSRHNTPGAFAFISLPNSVTKVLLG